MTYSPLLAAYEAGQRMLTRHGPRTVCDGCGCSEGDRCVGPHGPCAMLSGDRCTMCTGEHPDAPGRNRYIQETLL